MGVRPWLLLWLGVLAQEEEMSAAVAAMAGSTSDAGEDEEDDSDDEVEQINIDGKKMFYDCIQHCGMMAAPPIEVVQRLYNNGRELIQCCNFGIESCVDWKCLSMCQFYRQHTDDKKVQAQALQLYLHCGAAMTALGCSNKTKWPNFNETVSCSGAPAMAAMLLLLGLAAG
jgi:hypothetical protein